MNNYPELEQRIPRLAQLSDKLSESLAEKELRINGLSLGVPAYIDVRKEYMFCYDRINGKWGFYIRRDQVEDGQFIGYDYQPLNNTTRHIRIECFLLIDELTAQMIKNADKMIKKLEKVLGVSTDE